MYRCTKSLYKNTYRENAFKKGKSYSVIEENELGLYLIDEEGHSFYFAKSVDRLPFYLLNEYFEKEDK